jgi:hypothetical protein
MTNGNDMHWREPLNGWETAGGPTDEHEPPQGMTWADDAAPEDEEVEMPAPEFYTVAVYEEDRAYGGPEEGGWWYDCGTRVDRPSECGMTGADFPRIFAHEDEASVYCRELNARLDNGINSDGSNRDLSSVACVGRYVAHVEEGYPAPGFPETRPHYE